MEIQFNRKPKSKQIGVRLTDEEMKQLQALAKEHNASMMETAGVLIRAALKELEGKGRKKGKSPGS